MTTLFNLFCPFVLSFDLNFSVSMLIMLTLLLVMKLVVVTTFNITKSLSFLTFSSLFPFSGVSLSFFVIGFMFLSVLNLISLVSFSYPVTTTLVFNFSFAFILWNFSLWMLFNKKNPFSVFLPSNSPWYLSPFLCLVEMASILVRPITLCFRLLANMSAGHILLALICKLTYGAWLLGVLFGLLELMVAVVQAFVFLMLVSVYLEEALSH